MLSWELAPALQDRVRELAVRDSEGKTVLISLDRDRITLGRSSTCELCYPDDAGLSRQHLALDAHRRRLARRGPGQQERHAAQRPADLEGPTPFRPGDRISAGHLTIEFADVAAPFRETVVFVDHERELFERVHHGGRQSRRRAGRPSRPTSTRPPSCRAPRRCAP